MYIIGLDLFDTELCTGILLQQSDIFFVFFNILRIEISDHGRSEVSEDSLPVETTVKFISEVSSKVCIRFVCQKVSRCARYA